VRDGQLNLDRSDAITSAALVCSGGQVTRAPSK
jgi:hypothetical protein